MSAIKTAGVRKKNSRPFISLKDFSIKVRNRFLFRDLSWEIRIDENWAVVGPNGSGKSTLLKAIAGLFPGSGGSISYLFIRGARREAALKKISYAGFEVQRKVLGMDSFHQERWNPALNEDVKTVSEFLLEKDVKRISRYHIIYNYSGKKFLARRQAIIGLMGIKGLLKKKVVELSNGERRKVTIARALLKEPKILILDNPFSGLDEGFRRKFAKILSNLMHEKMNVIVAMTNRDEIPLGITHVLSLKNHRVISKETIREYFSSAKGGPASGGQRQSVTFSRPYLKASGISKTIIKMENVSVSYHGKSILHDINWVIKKAEKWALLGPNGAGKTTLLSLILGDNPQAYANNIHVFGKRKGTGESIWEIKKRIGWVSPELQLYYPRGVNCLEVVCSGWFDSIGLYQKCSPRKRAAALKWLKRFGLSARSKKTFADLSEGEQRLVLLARAMVKDPPLLLLDEPCQGLDASNRDKFLKALDFVCRRTDKTIIYVTHRTDEFPKCITHVLKLKDGHIEGISRRDMRPHLVR